MKQASTLLLMLLPATAIQAQIGNHGLNASSAMHLLNAGPGDERLVIERRFGFDSSYVELLHADADWASTQLASYRFNPALYFLFDAERLTSGSLVSGLFPTPGASSLLLLNDDGSIAWSKTINGMEGSQRRFPKLFAEGDDFVAYSNTDGFFSDLFYRLEGDAGGTAWSAMEISTNDNVPQRFYDGAATGTPGDHILVGSRVEGAEAQVLMARIDGSGVQWMKQYDLGSAETQFEEATDAVMLSNGEFACVMTARETASTTAAFVMRFNSNGDPIWTTKLTDAGGLFAGAVTELADGSLLIAAGMGFLPRLLRLSSAGELLSATGCATCFGGIGSLTRTGNGGLVGTNGGMVFEITEEGLVCDFTAIVSVTAAPYSPVVTSIAATAVAATLTAGDVPLLDRVPANMLTDGCVLSGVPEQHDRTALKAYPVPSAGLVRLTDARAGEPFTLRALDGRMVAQGRYRDGVDLGALPSGTYVLELTTTGARVRLVRE